MKSLSRDIWKPGVGTGRKRGPGRGGWRLAWFILRKSVHFAFGLPPPLATGCWDEEVRN